MLNSNQDLSESSPELRELSSTDLNFLEDGLAGHTNAICDLDTILDDFQADTHLLLTNPDQLLDGKFCCHQISLRSLKNFMSLVARFLTKDFI